MTFESGVDQGYFFFLFHLAAEGLKLSRFMNDTKPAANQASKLMSACFVRAPLKGQHEQDNKPKNSQSMLGNLAYREHRQPSKRLRYCIRMYSTAHEFPDGTRPPVELRVNIVVRSATAILSAVPRARARARGRDETSQTRAQSRRVPCAVQMRCRNVAHSACLTVHVPGIKINHVVTLGSLWSVLSFWPCSLPCSLPCHASSLVSRCLSCPAPGSFPVVHCPFLPF